MLDEATDPSNLSLAEIPLNQIPENVLQIMRNHDAFCASGVFGEQCIGEPDEYEKLVLEDESGIRILEYFNKGISYMFNGTDEDRPVFQVFAQLQVLQRKD